jgi:hypothetical protein
MSDNKSNQEETFLYKLSLQKVKDIIDFFFLSKTRVLTGLKMFAFSVVIRIAMHHMIQLEYNCLKKHLMIRSILFKLYYIFKYMLYFRRGKVYVAMVKNILNMIS